MNKRISTATDLQTAFSIVCYFDIYGFSEVVRDKGEDVAISLLEIWQWIGTNIKRSTNFVYLFSDCGFLHYPINNGKTVIDLVHECIEDVELLLDQFMDHDFFIKGAIAIGNTYYNENVLIGTSVIDAVRYAENCLAPFVVFPICELEKGLTLHQIQSEVKRIRIIPTKDRRGTMRSCIIFPSDIQQFCEKIRSRSDFYLTKGPFEFAKFWYETNQFINNEVLDEYRSR
jgi:hypothetical protein